jgi:hypothetical protein
LAADFFGEAFFVAAFFFGLFRFFDAPADFAFPPADFGFLALVAPCWAAAAALDDVAARFGFGDAAFFGDDGTAATAGFVRGVRLFVATATALAVPAPFGRPRPFFAGGDGEPLAAGDESLLSLLASAIFLIYFFVRTKKNICKFIKKKIKRETFDRKKFFLNKFEYR